MSKQTLTVLGLVTIAAVAACGSSSGSSAPVCPPDDPACRAAATVDEGAVAVQSDHRKCVDCHTKQLSGSTTPIQVQNAAPDVKLYPPNLTNDKAKGVGNWTDEQLAEAIRNGVDNTSLELCPQMQHFSTMTDREVFSIVLYLRSIPPVVNDVPRSVCPPLK